MTDNAKKIKWEKENLRTVSCRLRTEEAEKFKDFAAYRGTTAHALLADYVRKCLNSDEAVPATIKSNMEALLKENAELKRKLKVMAEAVDLSRERALHAEKLVDTWLRSADNK